MAEEEVITLDSGDEADDSNSGSSMNYDPSNYSDLLAQRPRVVPQVSKTKPINATFRSVVGGRPLPKKPGQFPPFALFSQEQRKLLVDGNPTMPFGEIGRVLGERWHLLTEEEKEDYRNRARVIQEQKLRAWEKQVKAIRTQYNGPGQRSIIPSQNLQRKRRTHGYAIFSSERRKMYTAQGMAVQEVTQLVAEEWRLASAQVKATYEARANKINTFEDEKFQRLQQQQQRQQLQQQQLQAKNRMRKANGVQRPPINLPVNSSLRISKVTSLATPTQQQSTAATTSQITLPLGISISRVEPEISIVEEQHRPVQPPRQANATPLLNANQRAPVQRPQLQRGQLPNARGRGRGRPLPPPPLGRGGPARPMRPQLQRLDYAQGNTSLSPRFLNVQNAGRGGMIAGGVRGAKRNIPMTSPMGQIGHPLKKPRVQPRTVTDLLGLGAPIPPNNLLSCDRYCRLCAELYPSNGPMYELSSKPKLLEKIDNTLALKINSEKDQSDGYPNAICRKCCHMLSSFDEFKRRVDEGSAKLSRVVALNLERQLKEKEKEIRNGFGSPLPLPAVLNAPLPLPESEEMSILPDLETPMESSDIVVKPVQIKQEKHSGIPTVAAVNIKDEPFFKEEKKEEQQPQEEEESILPHDDDNDNDKIEKDKAPAEAQVMPNTDESMLPSPQKTNEEKEQAVETTEQINEKKTIEEPKQNNQQEPEEQESIGLAEDDDESKDDSEEKDKSNETKSDEEKEELSSSNNNNNNGDGEVDPLFAFEKDPANEEVPPDGATGDDQDMNDEDSNSSFDPLSFVPIVSDCPSNDNLESEGTNGEVNGDFTSANENVNAEVSAEDASTNSTQIAESSAPDTSENVTDSNYTEESGHESTEDVAKPNTNENENVQSTDTELGRADDNVAETNVASHLPILEDVGNELLPPSREKKLENIEQRIENTEENNYDKIDENGISELSKT